MYEMEYAESLTVLYLTYDYLTYLTIKFIVKIQVTLF